MSIMQTLMRPAKLAIRGLDYISPLADLGIRLYVADVFWKSGLTKMASWDSTVYLFTNLYNVPYLSPEVAAASSTAVELGGAVLLAINRVPCKGC